MKRSFFVRCLTGLGLSAFALGGVAWGKPAPKTLPPATQAIIEKLLRAPAVQSGHIGLAIVSLGEAKSAAQFPASPYDGGAQPLLFARDEAKRFLPASNMKLFTAAWVLKQLGPNTAFTTKVWAADSRFLREGLWPANTPLPIVLTLMGDGDPTLMNSDLRAMARDIVKNVPGRPFIIRTQNSTVGDALNAENNGNRYPEGWTLDDTLWYYGTPVTGLAIERNQIDVTLTGTTPGTLADMKWAFPPPFEVLNFVKTVAKGDPRAGTVAFDRGDDATPLGNTLRITGFLAPGASDTEGVAVPDPKEWARSLFAKALLDAGAQVVNPDPQDYIALQSSPLIGHLSAPIGIVLKRFLKNSDNLYGEMLLRRAGSILQPNQTAPMGVGIDSKGMANRAHRALATWLVNSKVPTRGLNFSDGCGLSRYDLVTPIAVARLLCVAQTLPGAQSFYDALPIAGVDGTLKKRMTTTRAKGNVRAKTGSLALASCLSGYVTTRDNQRLAFSILTNEVDNTDTSRAWQDQLVSALADATWQSSASTAKKMP